MSDEASVAAKAPEAIVAELEARARRVDTPCGDGTMAWRIWGEGEPLVLGHGAQGNWTHWIRNIDALSRGRMVIAADLPGHGDSAMPPSEDHPAISAALAQGLRQILGSGVKADIVGFSFGGVAFAAFASYYPELARRIILIGTGGLDTPLGKIDLGRLSGLEGDARQARLKANLLGVMLHHEDSADDLAIHLLVKNARMARLMAVQDLVMPDRLIHILAKVEVQVDAIWGELDRPHPDPDIQAEVIRRFEPNTDFRSIADAGHWVMYERPAAFNAVLLDMLHQPLRDRP